MKNLLRNFIIVNILFFTTCIFAQQDEMQERPVETEFSRLYKPENPEAVLILFGGFPETAENIENGFPITESALENNVAVSYLNYNRKLWLEESDKSQLANNIKEMINTNDLPSDKIYFGGMSSGGNIALLIGNYLSQNAEYDLSPSGVFVIDSPVDIAALYRIAEQNIERNFSQASVGESSFMLNYFKPQLGNPDEEIEPYEKRAPFTFETKNAQNLENLKNTKLRFYTEPDKTWWKENMGIDYEQMNAFHLKRLSNYLTSQDFKKIEYITTEDKGYRANGERNPHSWSIVDKEDLLQWMLEE
ncbi:hypothetical protein GCM10007103_17110 [Salinimicrobium marinum]|uniref:Alpha/beta hydrolase n=1 Tax=Salinimicrobium marinum TaxID=680283 RepID=A0A918SCY0_9FLAO|nr:hypothetical protein [Salinimicrobium marinum]GHA36198.1 hypothetical protein GCM10007103_17110 [Salinimicrobium marinum]